MDTAYYRQSNKVFVSPAQRMQLHLFKQEPNAGWPLLGALKLVTLHLKCSSFGWDYEKMHGKATRISWSTYLNQFSLTIVPQIIQSETIIAEAAKTT